MIKLKGTQHLLLLGKRGATILLAVTLGFATLLYSMTAHKVAAAQLNSRRVTVETSQADATGVDYNFAFTTQSPDIDVEGVIFEFCTTPLGTCTLPTGMDVDADIVGVGTQTFTQAAAFAEASAAGQCTVDGTGDTQYCVSRTAPTAETAGSKALQLTGITNPSISSGNFTTVFVRITLYDNAGFSNSGGAGNQIVHTGTVAAAIVRQLTTTGRVQERLEFCVGALDKDTAVPDDCGGTFPTTTTIDLGIIDNSAIVASPVPATTTNPGNDMYGIMNVDTNASNGVAITYFPEPASSVLNTDADQTRNFRVLPTDCSATEATFTDQCFRGAGPTGQVFAINQEWFGMAVACFNFDDAGGTALGLTTSFLESSGATFNGDNAYGGDWDGTAPNEAAIQETGMGADNCEEEAHTGYEWGWDNSGTPDDIVTTNTVVDNEIIKVRFGAVAAPTTPTGQYFVTTTYVATPTY